MDLNRSQDCPSNLTIYRAQFAYLQFHSHNGELNQICRELLTAFCFNYRELNYSNKV